MLDELVVDYLKPRPRTWACPSFGPRQPVRQRRLPGAAGPTRDGLLDEPERRLLGQGAHGELLRELKSESLHRYDFATRDGARQEIFEYIEVFYNRKRRHSALGYLSPAEFEMANAA